MGVLCDRTGERWLSLGTRCLIGRSSQASLILAGRQVSAEHAMLSWAHGAWHLRDIGSRNGTWLDNTRLGVGERHPVRAGAAISLGSPEETWRLIDAGPPGVVGLGPGGALRAARDGLLALPDDLDPMVTLFQGPDEAWVLESEAHTAPFVNDAIILLRGCEWRLLWPCAPVEQSLPSTLDPAHGARAGGVELDLRVSLDEEHVEVLVTAAGQRLEPAPRAHHFLTLALARAWLADAAEGVADGEQGWLYVEDLCSMLRIDLAALNLYVFRARQQLAELGMPAAATLFERRRLSRQLRLNAARVTVSTI